MSKTNPQRKISRLQLKQLKEKYAKLEEQHATNLVERNSFLVEKERLEDRVSELEAELYFCNRNKLVGEVVDERTKVETR